MYSVTKRGMKFEALARHQDGKEWKLFDKLKDAEEWVIDSAKIMNGMTITVDDIAYFESVPVVINQDKPIERKEFTGKFVVCVFWMDSGWCQYSYPVEYHRAVELYNVVTENGQKLQEGSRGSFCKIHKAMDARMFPEIKDRHK